MALAFYRLAFLLRNMRIPIIPYVINTLFVRILFGCQIGLGAKLGRGVLLGCDGLGIVIHARAVIGKNVVIGSGVVIGGTTKKYRVPVIGDNTWISVGAKVLGSVAVGRNVVIGANAVVLDNVPDNCMAAGVPAKVIKEGIDICNYRSFPFHRIVQATI